MEFNHTLVKIYTFQYVRYKLSQGMPTVWLLWRSKDQQSLAYLTAAQWNIWSKTEFHHISRAKSRYQRHFVLSVWNFLVFRHTWKFNRGL